MFQSIGWSKNESADIGVITQIQNSIIHWTPIITTSMFATVLSQGVHNCQLQMQADHSLTYLTTLQRLWQVNGIASLYRGAEARIGLLLVVVTFNEHILKPAWSPVPV